jgi:DNA-binding NtrC family response regulator
MPPLRSRGADVLLLARYFSAKYAGEMGRAAPPYTDRALGSLGRCAWPGNVRELENLVQRLMAMMEGAIIDAPDLPAGMRSECFVEERGLAAERTRSYAGISGLGTTPPSGVKRGFEITSTDWRRWRPLPAERNDRPG